jgi:hypothetical protein
MSEVLDVVCAVPTCLTVKMRTRLAKACGARVPPTLNWTAVMSKTISLLGLHIEKTSKDKPGPAQYAALHLSAATMYERANFTIPLVASPEPHTITQMHCRATFIHVPSNSQRPTTFIMSSLCFPPALSRTNAAALVSRMCGIDKTAPE